MSERQDKSRTHGDGSAGTQQAAGESISAMQGLLQRPLEAGMGMGGDSAEAMAGVHLGRVVQLGPSGLLVDLPHRKDPVPAQALCRLTQAHVGQVCAVLFVEGDRQRPLVLGCVVDALPPVQRAVDLSATAADQIREEEAGSSRLKLVDDGQVLRIEAMQELELRCGEAVIVLQKNGCIEIRGNYITTQATATQRIRGGSVHVN